ncbi:MAG: hypothetical protein S4CHLAM6_13920 [Chlamydiae bacterium]|nr:hypothetical protein [Chlamydiota bacterium]
MRAQSLIKNNGHYATTGRVPLEVRNLKVAGDTDIIASLKLLG